MSQSEAKGAVDQIDYDELRRLCETLSAKAKNGTASQVPADVITQMLTASTLLFNAATHEDRRPVEAFVADGSITATSVVVTVSAMLRAADLNSFDLAMWFTGRPPDLPTPAGGP